jgi:hypothetical protein
LDSKSKLINPDYAIGVVLKRIYIKKSNARKKFNGTIAVDIEIINFLEWKLI